MLMPSTQQEKLKFYKRFGLVEQLQVVASTAVVVAMVTILTIYTVLGRELTYLLFVTVVVVGVFGFLSVFFTVRYGQKIEEQRRDMLAINTISEAISNSVRANVILMNALKTVTNLMEADHGWIYLHEVNKLRLAYKEGTEIDFIHVLEKSGHETRDWKKEMVLWDRLKGNSPTIPTRLKEMGIRVWISEPLETSDGFAGVLILASKDIKRFDEKKMNLLSVFVSQINVALDNAQLFEKLNVSKQLYADLFEHSPDMYHIIDKDGKIVSCNQTEIDNLGYTKDELIGADIRILYPPDEHQKLEKKLDRIFNKGENLNGIEERIQRKDGTPVDVSVNTSLMYKGGKPVKVRVVMRNITETKMMREKLLQVQRIDSLGSLAGGIAHDFNNILLAILNAASIMKRKMEPKNQWYDYVELIESSSRRGGALTQQLLTFARQKNINYHPVDVNDVIRDTIRLMERSLDKSIKLRSGFTEDPTVIEGDERQLQQVLMNLILNARDAIPQGGTIKLSTKVEYLNQERIFTPHGSEGHYILLRVEDNGSGMDNETMEKIFEPFFTTKDTGKGTGLGLSVVYGIVNKHKGFIIVDSQPGVGTIFSIYLPQVHNENKKSVKGKWKNEKVTGGTENIIVIEDDILVSRMIRDMLTNLGYSVKLCVDGEEGLRELRNHDNPYELLVLDLNMPHISGRDVLLDLRKFNRSIPVIISTGYGEHVLDEQEIRGEIQAYIKKPYDEIEFGSLVRRVLDKHKQPTLQ